MKKNLKKLWISILAVVSLILSAVLATGCYQIKSGKMKDVEGTYKLVTYSTNKDLLETRGILCYIVIRSDGNGYYAYRDNDTSMYIGGARCRFTQDTENAGHYSYVEMEFSNSNTWKTLGINAGSESTSLNSNLPTYKGNLFQGTLAIDYYTTVRFERVSKKTDTSYITAWHGNMPILPYGAAQYDGLYNYGGVQCDDYTFDTQNYETPFVYSYVNLDLFAGKGEMWYMLKADEQERYESFNISIAYDNSGYNLILSNGDTRIKLVNNYGRAVGISSQATVDDTTYDIMWTFHYIGDDTSYDMAEVIAQEIEIYNASKTL